jgi:chalcone synthase
MAPPSGELINAGSAEVPSIGLPMLPRGQPRAEGPASILGIGTAVPPAEFLQSEYPDFFFNITNTSEKEALKGKFRRICKCTVNITHEFSHTERALSEILSRCTVV